MVLFILICAQVFSLAFRGLQGEKLIEDLFAFLPGGVNADIWFLMALIFVLGFFIEWIEISYIAVPLFLPIFNAAGVDPVWLAMLITVNLQTSFLTPPFGWALFFLRGVAPPQITTRHIYVGVVPFVAPADAGHRAGVLLPADRHLAAQGHRLVKRPPYARYNQRSSHDQSNGKQMKRLLRDAAEVAAEALVFVVFCLACLASLVKQVCVVSHGFLGLPVTFLDEASPLNRTHPRDGRNDQLQTQRHRSGYTVARR